MFRFLHNTFIWANVFIDYCQWSSAPRCDYELFFSSSSSSYSSLTRRFEVGEFIVKDETSLTVMTPSKYNKSDRKGGNPEYTNTHREYTAACRTSDRRVFRNTRKSSMRKVSSLRVKRMCARERGTRGKTERVGEKDFQWNND